MTITKEQLARMIDHTLLKPTSTKKDIIKLCQEAKKYHFATVCVNPTYVPLAAKLLKNTDVKVCTVIGFPLGSTTTEVKAFETETAIKNGAREIDMVMNIGAMKSGNYKLVKEDVEGVVKEAKRRGVVVKVIIETGYLTDAEKVKACSIVKEAGADFVKTCYDDKTEVLTADGWKYFKDLTMEDEIVTLNPKTGYIEYQKPIRIVNEPYSGILIKIIVGNGTEIVVTPNHMIYCDMFNRRWRHKPPRKQYELIPAHELYYKNKIICIKRDANWNGKQLDYFILPSCIKNLKHYNSKTRSCENGPIQIPPRPIPMKDWIQFFGWYISEGCCYSFRKQSPGHSKVSYEVSITQKNPEYTNEICALIKRMGFHPVIYYDRKKQCWRITIYSKQLYHYLSQFSSDEHRYLPNELKMLDKETLRLLLHALCKGDGHFNQGKISQYLTVSRRLADDIQEITLKCGYVATIKTVAERDRVIGSRKIPTHGHQYSNVLFTHRRKEQSNRYQKERYSIINYSGHVHCVEVPNHVIYVRRFGKPFWCGNSTGFGSQGATIPDVKLMRKSVGEGMGVKAAGGIRTFADAVAMIEAGATRIGTSHSLAIMTELK